MRSAGVTTVRSWWAHDASHDQHLVFAVAAPGYSELQVILRRVGLSKPTVANHLLPFERGFFEAARTPGRLLWMPLEQCAEGLTRWRTEEQLRPPRAVSP